MKNIRRLIIVMTFAIMALLMMTAVSFAGIEEIELKVDDETVETVKGTDGWELIEIDDFSTFGFSYDTSFRLKNMNDVLVTNVSGSWAPAKSYLYQNFAPTDYTVLADALSTNLDKQLVEGDNYYVLFMYSSDETECRKVVIHTTTAYHQLNVITDGVEQPVKTGLFQNKIVEYAVLDGTPQSYSITRTGSSAYYSYNWNYTNSISLSNANFSVNWKAESWFSSGDPNKFLEGIGTREMDNVLFFRDANNTNIWFFIIVKPLPLVINSYTLNNEAYEPTMIENGDETVAYIRLKTLNYILININEKAKALNFQGKNAGSYNGGNIFMFEDTLESSYKIGAKDKDALISKMEELNIPEPYSDYHNYYWLTLTDETNSYPIFFDIGIDPPDASIESIECDNEHVTVKFQGDELDLEENGFKSEWIQFEIKDDEDNEYQMAGLKLEEVGKDSVRYSFTVPDTMKPDTTDTTLTAKYLTQEPVTKELVLPASIYWSKYVDPVKDAPEKIASGDKTWPEFVGYYKITKPVELAWFAGLVNGELEGVEQNAKANAFLANDIECQDTDGWENWDEETTGVRFWDCTIGQAPTTNNESTGRYGVSFKGIFDGNGHSISGLYILPAPYINNSDAIMDIALFPITYNAEIRNLGVEDSFIGSAGSWLGSRAAGIVSNADHTIIENCWFTGNVKTYGYSEKNAGGILGQGLTDVTVKACYSNGKLVCDTDSGGNTAAIAYYCNDIVGCYSRGNNQGVAIATSGKAYSCYSDSTNLFASNSVTVRDSFRIQGSPDYAAAQELTEEQFKDGTLLEGLDQEYFCADDGNKNDGYPILFWQSDLYALKKSAAKEVKYLLDPADYALSRKELEAAVETAVSSIMNAQSEQDVTEAKDAAVQALKGFKSDATLVGENDEAVKELQKKLAEIEAKIELQGASIKVAKESVVYNGKAQTPAVTVTGASGAELKEGEHYTVAYEANTDPGVATVTVTGAGTASLETKTATFNILPKKAALKKVTPAKKKLTITWAKDTTVTGYEVQYGLKKNFKGAKTAKITKAGTAKKVVKKLKSGKKYFVRVRSYKTVDKTKLYGAWSKAKKAKVK